MAAEIFIDTRGEPEGSPFWFLLNLAHHIEKFYVPDDPAKTRSNSRRIWNSLIAEELDEEEVDSILENTSLPFSDFVPLSDSDFELVVNALDEAGVELPILLSEVTFRRTKFQEKLDLSGYLFVNICFAECTFEAGFSLDGCVVLDTISAQNGEHHLDLEIHGTNVYGSTDFSNSHFYSEARFSDGFYFSFSVEKCTFESEASFRGMEIDGDAHFTGATFNHSTSFKGTSFNHQVPRFFGATIHEDTNFADVSWPKISQSHQDQAESARDAVRAYECLKRIAGDQRKFRLEHMFLQLEMKSQERAEGPVQSIPSRLFRYLSDYGWSYTRPVVALSIAWSAAGVFFASSTCESSENGALQDLSCWLEAFAISFANLFAFLGISRTLLSEELRKLNEVFGGEAVAGLQMVVGPILIFFVLLAFRNRFRMK